MKVEEQFVVKPEPMEVRPASPATYGTQLFGNLFALSWQTVGIQLAYTWHTVGTQQSQPNEQASRWIAMCVHAGCTYLARAV